MENNNLITPRRVTNSLGWSPREGVSVFISPTRPLSICSFSAAYRKHSPPFEPCSDATQLQPRSAWIRHPLPHRHLSRAQLQHLNSKTQKLEYIHSYDAALPMSHQKLEQRWQIHMALTAPWIRRRLPTQASEFVPLV